jgi:hypothetical protein
VTDQLQDTRFLGIPHAPIRNRTTFRVESKGSGVRSPSFDPLFRGLGEAGERDWIVVDMKSDWKTAY